MFLGGTFTPGTSINSPVAMNNGHETGTATRGEIRTHTDDNKTRQKEERAQLFNKLAAYELLFAYLLFESFGRQSCVTPSTSQREDPLTIPTVIRSTENKIHSPPQPEEPSLKQREDSRLNILPPL